MANRRRHARLTPVLSHLVIYRLLRRRPMAGCELAQALAPILRRRCIYPVLQRLRQRGLVAKTLRGDWRLTPRGRSVLGDHARTIERITHAA